MATEKLEQWNAYRQGLSITEIAEMHGVKRSTVSSNLRQLGVKIRPGRRPGKDYSR